MTKTCWIDTFGPLPVLEPTTVAEIGDIVRAAVSRDEAIYPLGGQTKLDCGLPPNKLGVAVGTTRLDKVCDYPARDMTITVQAGITMSQLQSVLSEENQRLPVDVPRPDEATLGGSLAANVSGPRRYGFGTLRDYVIGISVVNDEGNEVKAGGRVVKNVAGYDLCKLYIGSLGTLGIISQVTLKLRPKPEQQALVLIASDAEKVEPLLGQLHESRSRPVCIDLLNAEAVRHINDQVEDPLPSGQWITVVGFEDNRSTVTWQIEQLTRELLGTGQQCVGTRVGAEANDLWQALVELPARPEACLVVKANLLPHACAAFCREAEATEEGVSLQAHAGSGIVIIQAEEKLGLDTAGSMLTSLQATAARAQGNVIVLRCPVAWKSALPVWGIPRGDVFLMRAIKEKLDPRRVFNPGRFLDGM